MMILQEKRQPNPILKRLDCPFMHNEDLIGKYKRLFNLMRDPSYSYDFFILRKLSMRNF